MFVIYMVLKYFSYFQTTICLDSVMDTATAASTSRLRHVGGSPFIRGSRERATARPVLNIGSIFEIKLIVQTVHISAYMKRNLK